MKWWWSLLAGGWLAGLSAIAYADTPPASSARPSGLDGWGSYKFGMTQAQALAADGQSWKTLHAVATSPGSFLVFSPVQRGVEQYGLSFTGMLQRFDREDGLVKIVLNFNRGGPTVDSCKQKFQGLLLKLETQYGPFEPAEINAPGDIHAASKTEIVQALPGGHSFYRDLTQRGVNWAQRASADVTYSLLAKRAFGARFIAVSMHVADNTRFSGVPMIPPEDLAVDPKLALPECGIGVMFQSKADAVPEAAALAPKVGGDQGYDSAPSVEKVLKDADALVNDLESRGFGTGKRTPCWMPIHGNG